MARKPSETPPRVDDIPMTDKDGEVRELTKSDFAGMRPAAEAAPALVARARQRGRPPLDNPKEQITLRLSTETLEYFRAGGRGWQTRLAEVPDGHVKRARRKVG